jgi:hypothetical protein
VCLFESVLGYRSMDTLQRHMPVAGQDGVDELLKIAWRFEEKIFQAATDQVSLYFSATQRSFGLQRVLLFEDYFSRRECARIANCLIYDPVHLYVFPSFLNITRRPPLRILLYFILALCTKSD